MMQEITFNYAGKEDSGILLQEQDNNYMIKLSSGYNIIIPIKDTKILTKKEIHKEAFAKTKIRQENTLPLITILHTGGTIASKVDYSTGAVTAQFDPDDLLSTYPELLHLANINSMLIRNMMSDDLRFAHYNIMAQAVLDAIIKGAQGIIVTHGTDTLHYTAAALSFMLEGINIPIIIVGSQRSSDRGSSDSATNLKGAVTFITKTRNPGVYVALHETTNDDSIAIYDGLHVRKMHSSRRDAFKAVNAPLIARVKNDKLEIIDQERLNFWKSQSSHHPQIISFNEKLKIGWWKSHPQSFAQELLTFADFDGVLIEGTGLGHAPISKIDEFTDENLEIRKAIETLAKKIPVVMTLQTIYGRVNMDVYSPGRTLQELGVIGQNCDMIPEVAFIKLAWILSHEKDKTKIKSCFEKNYRGEISSKTAF